MTALAAFKALQARHLKLVTAESCTGGMVAAAITDIDGSSAIFESGFVTYSNESKIELLKVDQQLIADFGAVSEEVASAMASGALTGSKADIAVSVTGIAGPTGGSVEKPVGTVWFCCATREGRTFTRKQNFGPIGRAKIRSAACTSALQLICEALETTPD